MELNDEFEVPLAVPEAWAVLTDLARIAPCLPGARLDEVSDGEYHGTVRVKVGPITVEYRGVASFVELEEPHRVVLKATGRETRGQGNAQAMVTATLSEAGPRTRVSVATELDITGRVAQFGRGALADVSSKLLGQFVSNLERDLATGPSEGAAAIEGVGAPDGAEGAGGAEGSERAEGSGGRPTAAGERWAVRDGAGGAAAPAVVEPLNLVRLAGGSVAKRVGPIAAVALVAILVGVRRHRRR